MQASYRYGLILLALIGGALSLVPQARSQVVEKAAAVDRFGAAMLCPTIHGGREWYADWQAERTVPPFTHDPMDDLVRNSDSELRIRNGVASWAGGVTRLYVMTQKDAAGHYTQPQWQNVEMTIYVKPGAKVKELSYQALDLSARSGEQHNDKYRCEGTSYHATARFDGQFGFKKELWHTGGYTKLRPNPAPKPWDGIPTGKWIGIKAIFRNAARGKHVNMQMYMDAEANNNWKLVSHYVDAGDWPGAEPGCDRPIGAVITEPRPCVYFRTDYVNVEMKSFSVREVAPLP